MDLTICTSCWNYAQYIKDWADGICSQKAKPKAVSFFNNGSTDNTKEEWGKAEKRFMELGIGTTYSESSEKIPFGEARNRSIKPAGTEWVCHFDVDDKMLPNYVSDCVPLSKSADVIAVGYQAFGKTDKVNIYEGGRTKEQMLTCPKICSPVAPFRKKLWTANPYEERMKSSWDTVLWLKFIHAGAKFAATSKPGYLYRVHHDSIFQRKQRNRVENLRNAMDIETFRRGLDPMVTCIIPHRETDKWRKRNFEQIYQRVRKNNPLWEILVDDCEGVWNKAKIVNRLAKEAKGTILVVMDNDVIPSDDGLYTALSKVVYSAGSQWALGMAIGGKKIHNSANWAIPHRMVYRMVDGWKEGDEYQFDREPYMGVQGGGCFIIRRDSYFLTGGMDEGFLDWGGEDLSFGYVAETILGRPFRHSDPLIHLWHPPQKTRKGAFGNNQMIGMKYHQGKGNQYVMHKLAEENRNKNFPGRAFKEIRCYLCTDLDHLDRLERKFPDPPEFIRLGVNMNGDKIGVIKTCIGPKIMLALPCVKQISDTDFNKFLKRYE